MSDDFRGAEVKHGRRSSVNFGEGTDVFARKLCIKN